MTNFDAQQLVDRIVRDVIARLRDRGLGASAVAEPDHGSALVLDEAVLTEALLEDRLNGHREIVVGKRTILTPTARDFLRKRDVVVSRRSPADRSKSGSSMLPLAIVCSKSATATSAVGASNCSRVEHDCWRDATRAAVDHVRSTKSGAIVLTEKDAAVGCLANRNAHVRAAVVDDAHGVRSAREMIGPNVLVVDPTGKSFVTLREILREFSAERITVPNGWEG